MVNRKYFTQTIHVQKGGVTYNNNGRFTALVSWVGIDPGNLPPVVKVYNERTKGYMPFVMYAFGDEAAGTLAWYRCGVWVLALYDDSILFNL